MARPLEFEREEALEAAMDLFWRQGFVSPPPKKKRKQLLDARAIGYSSFYATFGDPR